MGAPVRVWISASVGFALLTQSASAETLVHMSRSVWGCFDPNVTPALNDETNPNRDNPQWMAQTAAAGQCVIITPGSLWKPLSADYNGLTYVTHRGAIGASGSFWVPTAAINFSSPVEAVPAATQALLPPKALQAPSATANAEPEVQTTTQDQPAAAAPASAPPSPPTSDTGSSGGVVVVVLVILAVIWLARRPRRQKAKNRGRTKPVTTRMADREGNRPKITVTVTSSRSNSERSNPNELTVRYPKNKPGYTWYPHGSAASISGATVADGMVYVGQASNSWEENDASFIDPTLPVAPASAAASPLSYWPSYRTLTPECRHDYLEWLASGKQAPDQDIGYVFLYFYGLERRLLIDTPTPEEVRTLVAEVERLRLIYAGNHSFNGYSRRLLEAVAFLQNAALASHAEFLPDLAAPAGDMPLSLQVAIAREVVAGRTLSFELAAAALFGLREFWSANRLVLDGSARAAFLAVLRSRFATTFRSGFLLRNRKDSHLQLIYRGASSGLQVNLAERVELKDLPNPTTLTWTKLLNLAGVVAEDVTPYAKSLAYYPARANSLLGLVGCPVELRDTVAPEARRWLEGLPRFAPVAFGELAGHAIGTTTAKWTVRHRRQVSEALAGVGYLMEPEPEDNSERLEDNTHVQVFRCADRTPSRAMDVASAAAMLVVIIAKTVDHGTDEIAEFWVSRIPPRLSLTADQLIRLRARLAWLATRHVTLLRAKKLLGDATSEEREFCAWSATVAAGVTGAVGKAEVAVLEAIYDALSVSRHTLYAGLHEGIGAATAAANEPILVSDAVPETLHPIPRPPVERVDDKSDRLARIRDETDRVAAMLKDIFVEDEPQMLAPEPVGENVLAGLDPRHATLLARLLTRPEWPRDEFDKAASEAGVMPSGAMETINEWAFDYYGDALLEDGDPVVINHSLLPVGPEVTSAE
jgi:hypothetical protein